jgi:hypothetical protein
MAPQIKRREYAALFGPTTGDKVQLVARHPAAWRICKSMGLNLSFFARPYPLRRDVDIAHDGLPALGDVDVLDGHLLLALRAIFLQGRHLRGERPCQLIEGPLGAVLLRDILDVRGRAARHQSRRSSSSCGESIT